MRAALLSLSSGPTAVRGGRTAPPSAVACVVLAVVAALLAVPGAAPASATTRAPAAVVLPRADGTPTAIAGMTMRAGRLALTGTQTTRLTVAVHLVDPDGIRPTRYGLEDISLPCPCVVVEAQTSAGARYRATPQALGYRYVPLRLTSGTAQDGTWTGTATLGAGDAAVWRPTLITAGDLVAPFTDTPFAWSPFVALPASVTRNAWVNLHGSDWPVLSVVVPTTVIDVGTAYTVRGRVLLSRSRVPVTGLRLVLEKMYCSPELHVVPATAVRTSSTGRWSLGSTALAATWCAFWGQDALGLPLLWAGDWEVHQRATLTVSTSAHRVASGSAIVVSGVMRPAEGDDLWVYLQRYAAGTWRNEARMQHSLSGRYTFRVVHSSMTGLYRVRVANGYQYLGRTSPTFTLRWG